MSTQQRSNARPVQQQRKGPLLFIVSLLGGFAFSIFTAFLASIFIAWIGMHWWWKNEGIRHSQNLVTQDLNYLKDYDGNLATGETASEFAAGWAAAAVMA